MIFIILSLILCVNASDLVTSLPNVGKLPFTLYSGMLHLPNSQKYVHYMFVPSWNSPKTDPVLYWTNGGPGCSSLDGFFYENGPMKFDDNYDRKNLSMHMNEFAWAKVANVLYFEAPVGVGFSYSNDQNDYNTNDKITAIDNHAALGVFFEKYPSFKANQLFLSGESYGGKYIPELADLVVQDPAYNGRFKGWAVGNPSTDHEYDTFFESTLPTVHGHALISDETHDNLIRYCTGSMPNHVECNKAELKFEENMQDIDPYDMYSPCFTQRSGQTVGCVNARKATELLNMASVKKALNVDSSIQWEICSSKLNYHDNVPSVVPIYAKLARSNKYRFLVYSGDADTVVPYPGTWKWINNKLALPMQGKRWQSWKYADPQQGQPQIGGYVTYFGSNFTFTTVKGAAHMVPQTNPRAALHMIASFLANKQL
mmetsp:Transcript_8114/g.13990  ORF Transcript_8114/g.13990 Transcript_8114/m.13990 type:complete len:427 (+) Transcript_8114:3-1283(+)